MTAPTTGPAPGGRASRRAATVLAVDWTACDGRGLCQELLPELLAPDPWGYPRPITPGPRGEIVVPPALEPEARRATRLCPVLALKLTTTPP